MKKRRKYSSSHDRTLLTRKIQKHCSSKSSIIVFTHPCFHPISSFYSPLFPSIVLHFYFYYRFHPPSFLFTIVSIYHHFYPSTIVAIYRRLRPPSSSFTIVSIHHHFHRSYSSLFLFTIISIHRFHPLSFHIHIHSQSFLSTILFIHHYFHPSFPFTILFIHHCFHPSSFLFTIISTYHRSFHPPPFSSFLSTIISTISLLIAQNPISTHQRY